MPLVEKAYLKLPMKVDVTKLYNKVDITKKPKQEGLVFYLSEDY